MLIKTIELLIPVFKLNTVKGSPFESTYSSVWASLLTQTIKNPPTNIGDTGLIPGFGRSPGEGNQLVKNLPAMRETWVRSLGWNDPLEKGMATHSCILAWRIPYTEKPGGLQSMGWQRVGYD